MKPCSNRTCHVATWRWFRPTKQRVLAPGAFHASALIFSTQVSHLRLAVKLLPAHHRHLGSEVALSLVSPPTWPCSTQEQPRLGERGRCRCFARSTRRRSVHREVWTMLGVPCRPSSSAGLAKQFGRVRRMHVMCQKLEQVAFGAQVVKVVEHGFLVVGAERKNRQKTRGNEEWPL